jgi:hypothetical protein
MLRVHTVDGIAFANAMVLFVLCFFILKISPTRTNTNSFFFSQCALLLQKVHIRLRESEREVSFV